MNKKINLYVLMMTLLVSQQVYCGEDKNKDPKKSIETQSIEPSHSYISWKNAGIAAALVGGTAVAVGAYYYQDALADLIKGHNNPIDVIAHIPESIEETDIKISQDANVIAKEAENAAKLKELQALPINTQMQIVTDAMKTNTEQPRSWYDFFTSNKDSGEKYEQHWGAKDERDSEKSDDQKKIKTAIDKADAEKIETDNKEQQQAREQSVKNKIAPNQAAIERNNFSRNEQNLRNEERELAIIRQETKKQAPLTRQEITRQNTLANEQTNTNIPNSSTKKQANKSVSFAPTQKELKEIAKKQNESMKAATVTLSIQNQINPWSRSSTSIGTASQQNKSEANNNVSSQYNELMQAANDLSSSTQTRPNSSQSPLPSESIESAMSSDIDDIINGMNNIDDNSDNEMRDLEPAIIQAPSIPTIDTQVNQAPAPGIVQTAVNNIESQSPEQKQPVAPKDMSFIERNRQAAGNAPYRGKKNLVYDQYNEKDYNERIAAVNKQKNSN